MSFELHHWKHIEDELSQIVGKQLRSTSHALTTGEGSQFRSAVHESRKSVKKVRAVAAFLTEAGAKLPRKDRKRVKSAARALSRVRDSAAIIDTFDRVRRRYPRQLPENTYRILRRSLVAARDRTEARAQRDGVVADAAENVEKTRKSARKWRSPSIKWSATIPIVADSYRRSRNAMKRALVTGQSATLHRWRKELKTLWYQLRLTGPLMTGVSPLIAEVHRLETELGDDHNLVVLEATLRGCRELRSMRAEIRQIDRLAARMRQPLSRAWGRQATERPRWIAVFGPKSHVEVYLQLAEADQKEHERSAAQDTPRGMKPPPSGKEFGSSVATWIEIGVQQPLVGRQNRRKREGDNRDEKDCAKGQPGIAQQPC
jgi:CHAD domain-containing protein